MGWIEEAIAGLPLPRPAAVEPGQSHLVKVDRPSSPLPAAGDAVVNDGDDPEKHHRHGQPTDAELAGNENRIGKGHDYQDYGNPRIAGELLAPFLACGQPTARFEPLAVLPARVVLSAVSVQFLAPLHVSVPRRRL